MSSIKINKDRLLKKLRNGGDPSRKSLDPKFDKIASKYEKKGWDALSQDEQKYYRDLYDPYTKSENTLPQLTVISSPRGSEKRTTLANLDNIQSKSNYPLIALWKQFGKFDVSKDDTEQDIRDKAVEHLSKTSGYSKKKAQEIISKGLREKFNQATDEVFTERGDGLTTMKEEQDRMLLNQGIKIDLGYKNRDFIDDFIISPKLEGENVYMRTVNNEKDSLRKYVNSEAFMKELRGTLPEEQIPIEIEKLNRRLDQDVKFNVTEDHPFFKENPDVNGFFKTSTDSVLFRPNEFKPSTIAEEIAHWSGVDNVGGDSSSELRTSRNIYDINNKIRKGVIDKKEYPAYYLQYLAKDRERKAKQYASKRAMNTFGFGIDSDYSDPNSKASRAADLELTDAKWNDYLPENVKHHYNVYYDKNAFGKYKNGGPIYSGKGDKAQVSYDPDKIPQFSNLTDKIKNAYNKFINPTGFDWEASDKRLEQLSKDYAKAKLDSFNSNMDYMELYPETELSQNLRDQYTPIIQSPVDSNRGYTPNLQLKNGGDVSKKSLDPKFDKIAKKYEQKGWDSLTNEEQNYYRNLYDTYTKSENTLPLFTVLSAKKGSTGYNTLKALEDIKKDESLPVIQAWDQAGSPQINVEEYDMFNPHRAHTNNKDEMTIGKNVHGKAKYKDFLAELAHFYEKEQTGLTSFDHALKRTKEFIKLGDKKRYETPGTVEHNTHSVIEPRLDKAIRDKQQETEDLFWETNGKPFKTIDHLNKIKASEPFKIDLGENSNKKNGGSIGDPPKKYNRFAKLSDIKATNDKEIVAFENKNIRKTQDINDLEEIIPNIGAMEILLNSIASNDAQTNIPMAKKGGYLKDKNTYVTKDGKKTKRGLWANLFLSKQKNKKEYGGYIDLEDEILLI